MSLCGNWLRSGAVLEADYLLQREMNDMSSFISSTGGKKSLLIVLKDACFLAKV